MVSNLSRRGVLFEQHTLNANMNVRLRLLDLTGVFVGLREGVYQIRQ